MRSVISALHKANLLNFGVKLNLFELFPNELSLILKSVSFPCQLKFEFLMVFHYFRIPTKTVPIKNSPAVGHIPNFLDKFSASIFFCLVRGLFPAVQPEKLCLRFCLRFCLRLSLIYQLAIQQITTHQTYTLNDPETGLHVYSKTVILFYPFLIFLEDSN